MFSGPGGAAQPAKPCSADPLQVLKRRRILFFSRDKPWRNHAKAQDWAFAITGRTAYVRRQCFRLDRR
ncbi:protein of unknown function [Paraburkholderia dioscoreae]|uniref:Uncharacterized protein n=1 Tax=Paraburkholderia dioscoreae TaxID=2604047 RepID=A0A5Q4ZG89_9BURK|nr:protein of unknown function [Paraburkholderia dioscoreae]